MSDEVENRRQALSLNSLGADNAERANKVALSIRLDADIVAYFKAQGPGWQSRINAELHAIILLRRRAGSYETFVLTGKEHPFVRHFAETSTPLRLAGNPPEGILTFRKSFA